MLLSFLSVCVYLFIIYLKKYCLGLVYFYFSFGFSSVYFFYYFFSVINFSASNYTKHILELLPKQHSSFLINLTYCTKITNTEIEIN